jgi:deoxycytidine triphosphate deaminase
MAASRSHMPTLNKSEILSRLYDKQEDGKRLVVTPILDDEAQITGPGIDLRLSNQFIVFKHEHSAYIDVSELNDSEIRKVQSHVVVPFFDHLILHPKTLVLAATLEYISMSNDLIGTLEGRSSWARHGLIIATACAIDPGFKGCITLELSNLGSLPLYLYPGIRLAKLILTTTSSESTYSSKKHKYFCQVGPEFSKAHQDDEVRLFSKKVERTTLPS